MRKSLYKASDLNKMLPAATAEKFEIVGNIQQSSGAVVSAKYGRINFHTLSIDRAEDLIRMEYPHIKLKPEKPKKKTPSESK